MADSALDDAIEAVAIGCATVTTLVTITSLDPFKISPDNLFKLRFKDVGITSDAQMAAFRQVLIRVLPEQLVKDLEKIALSPVIVIKLVVNHVEALLLQLAAANDDSEV